jgi:hypothetical protein
LPATATGKPKTRLVELLFPVGFEHVGNRAGYSADDLELQILGITQKVWTQSPADQSTDPFSLKDSHPFERIGGIRQSHLLTGRAVGSILCEKENLGAPVENRRHPGSENRNGKHGSSIGEKSLTTLSVAS